VRSKKIQTNVELGARNRVQRESTEEGSFRWSGSVGDPVCLARLPEAERHRVKRKTKIEEAGMGGEGHIFL